MARSVYLDHAATTPLDSEVFEAMRPFFTAEFGNPSSVHARGRAARHAVEDARSRVASLLDCEPGDVVFTSGGTEANNLAILGTVQATDGGGMVTSRVEHESVLRAAESLAGRGHPVTILHPDDHGSVDVAQVVGAIDADTVLVSIMWVNNELGTISPVSEIAAACRDRGVTFHTDAVQAAGYFPARFGKVGADLATLSAHKFGGPKGAGALIIRGGEELRPRQVGGSQERGRRAGTENVAGFVGLATALELASARAEAERGRLEALRNRLAKAIRDRFGEGARINTPLDAGAAPHILSVSFGRPDLSIDGEMLLLGLDMAGVMASSGSACSSGAVEPSHVLRALEMPPELARATIRFSLGRSTTAEDIDYAVDVLTEALIRQGLNR